MSPRFSEEPLVSILIPAYNAQEWVADTLRSALAQTWRRKEIIVVDDGSTDHTLDVLRRFERRQGVRIVAQKNQGAAAARNTAFSLSHGDYIQWLDADDLLGPDKIERQMTAPERFLSARILFSCAFGKFSYRPYRARFTPSPVWENLTPAEWLIRKMAHNVYMQTGAWLVSHELTCAAGPWNTRLLGDDDGEYFCRVLLAADAVRFVPEARVYYRSATSNSLSAVGRSERKLRAHWLSMQCHLEYLRTLDDSDTGRAAGLAFLHASLPYFYPEWADIVGEMRQAAARLGGELTSPRLSWKYAWALPLFGWPLAKRLAQAARRMRWMAQRNWDKLLFKLHI